MNDFAKACGIGEGALRSYLGGTKPGIDKAVAIAQAANVSLDWLLTGADAAGATAPAVKPEAPEADPKLVRRLTREFIKVYKGLGIAVDQLDVVEMATEEHNRIRRHAAAGQALDAVVGYAVDQLRQRLLQANDEAASRKRPA